MFSKKDKDTWVKDYFNLIEVLSQEEIGCLETKWANEKNKNEYYFRTSDEIGKLDLWLIDTYNYQNLTVEMRALIAITPKENGCKIEIEFEKFQLFYLKTVIYFLVILINLFCIISKSIAPFIFGLFFVFVFYIQKRIIYRNTQRRIVQKLESMEK